MRLRTGRKVGRTLYIQRGVEASDADTLIGLVDDRVIAEEIVRRWNAHEDSSVERLPE